MGTLDLQMNALTSVDDEVKALVGDGKIYPQLGELNLALKEQDGALSWKQDMTVLDLLYWYDATSSSYDPEIATKEAYYAMLESEGMTDGDMVTFMDEKGYDWQIWTEIQQKEVTELLFLSPEPMKMTRLMQCQERMRRRKKAHIGLSKRCMPAPTEVWTTNLRRCPTK